MTALVVCDSGGLVAVDATVRRICGAFERFFAAGARGAPWFKAAYALYYRYIVLPSPAAAEQRSRIIAAGYESAEVLRQAWHNFGQPEADIRAELRGLTVPVWFAWARHDRVIPLSFCRPAIDAAQRGSLTTFDAGHATFLEQPDAFAEGFLAFAKDHAVTPFRLRPAA